MEEINIAPIGHSHVQHQPQRPGFGVDTDYPRCIVNPDAYQSLVPDDDPTSVILKTGTIVQTGSVPSNGGNTAEIIIAFTPGAARENETMIVYARPNPGADAEPYATFGLSESLADSYDKRRAVSARLTVESNTISATLAAVQGEFAGGYTEDLETVRGSTPSGLLTDCQYKNGAIASVQAYQGLVVRALPKPNSGFTEELRNQVGRPDDPDVMETQLSCYAAVPQNGDGFLNPAPALDNIYFDSDSLPGGSYPSTLIGDAYIDVNLTIGRTANVADSMSAYAECTWVTADPNTGLPVTSVVVPEIDYYDLPQTTAGNTTVSLEANNFRLAAPSSAHRLKRLRIGVRANSSSHSSRSVAEVIISRPRFTAVGAEGTHVIILSGAGDKQRFTLNALINYEAVPNLALGRQLKVTQRRSDDALLRATAAIVKEADLFKLTCTLADYKRATAAVSTVLDQAGLERYYAFSLGDFSRSLLSSALPVVGNLARRYGSTAGAAIGGAIPLAGAPVGAMVGEAAGEVTGALADYLGGRLKRARRDPVAYQSAGESHLPAFCTSETAWAHKEEDLFPGEWALNPEGVVDETFLDPADFEATSQFRGGEVDYNTGGWTESPLLESSQAGADSLCVSRPCYYAAGTSAGAAVVRDAMSADSESYAIGDTLPLEAEYTGGDTMETLYYMDAKRQRKQVVKLLLGRRCPFSESLLAEFKNGQVDPVKSVINMAHFPMLKGNFQGGNFIPNLQQSRLASVVISPLPFTRGPVTNVFPDEIARFVKYRELNANGRQIFVDEFLEDAAGWVEWVAIFGFAGDRPIYVTTSSDAAVAGSSWHMAGFVAMSGGNWNDVMTGTIAATGHFASPDQVGAKAVMAMTAPGGSRAMCVGSCEALNRHRAVAGLLSGDRNVLQALFRAQGMTPAEALAAAGQVNLSSCFAGMSGGGKVNPFSIYYAATVADVWLLSAQKPLGLASKEAPTRDFRVQSVPWNTFLNGEAVSVNLLDQSAVDDYFSEAIGDAVDSSNQRLWGSGSKAMQVWGQLSSAIRSGFKTQAALDNAVSSIQSWAAGLLRRAKTGATAYATTTRFLYGTSARPSASSLGGGPVSSSAGPIVVEEPEVAMDEVEEEEAPTRAQRAQASKRKAPAANSAGPATKRAASARSARK